MKFSYLLIFFFTLSRAIAEQGGPWSLDTISKQLEKLASAQVKRLALINKPKFHKVVLKSVGNRILFQESSRGHSFTVEEMEPNLRNILQENEGREEAIDILKWPTVAKRAVNLRKNSARRVSS